MVYVSLHRAMLTSTGAVYVSLHRAMLISTGAVYVNLRSVYSQIAIGPC